MTLEPKKQQLIVLSIGGLIFLTALILAMTTNKTSTPTETTPSSTAEITVPVDTADEKTNAKPVVKPTTKTPPKTAQTPEAYQKALATYAYKIQFVDCAALPAKLTFKQGVKVMLDNRDPKAHTVAFGSFKYAVKAYDFTIITAPTANTYSMTCDGRTVGQIVVQK